MEAILLSNANNLASREAIPKFSNFQIFKFASEFDHNNRPHQFLHPAMYYFVLYWGNGGIAAQKCDHHIYVGGVDAEFGKPVIHGFFGI